MSPYGKGMAPLHPMPLPGGPVRTEGLAASVQPVTSPQAATYLHSVPSTSTLHPICLDRHPSIITKPINNPSPGVIHDLVSLSTSSAPSFLPASLPLHNLDENINIVPTSTHQFPSTTATPHPQARSISPTSTLRPTSLPLKPTASLRFLFQNINGLNPDLHNPKLDSVHEFVVASQADVFCMSETNVAWHRIPTNLRLHARTSEWFEARHLSVAWNRQEDPFSPS